MDNDTMVQIFKHLNYCQLAKNILVSTRFRDLIQTHRYKLALLHVERISMVRPWSSEPFIQIFNNDLSPEEYKDWVVQNGYSKQAPLMGQAAVGPAGYQFCAYGNYKDPNRIRMPIFAHVKELNNETWPLFQHFVRLLTDPFIYINRVELVPQEETFNLLVEVIDRSYRGRLQCENLEFDFEANSPKFFNRVKDHMRCVKFRIAVRNDSVNRDEQLLDFFATGYDCASEIVVTDSHISIGVIIDLVKKFIGPNTCDECHFVHSIRGSLSETTTEALKSNYEKFFVKKESKPNGRAWITAHVFEFVNVNIGKKLQLTITSLMQSKRRVVFDIINL